MNTNESELVEGSGNVFRDLGECDADIKQAKATLAARIIAVLGQRGLTAPNASVMTGFPATDFVRTGNADLNQFTIDRLMKMLAGVDEGVRITVHVEPGQRRQNTSHSAA